MLAKCSTINRHIKTRLGKWYSSQNLRVNRQVIKVQHIYKIFDYPSHEAPRVINYINTNKLLAQSIRIEVVLSSCITYT